ncbi:hypothetical protein PEp14_00064 [Erwinia phage PEp14]|uniref:Uncharacterized protein n=1 Tax=Erwinia phage PEp14 TaxID=1131315 RepID=H2DE94_9CAUD|nr:hypothetical protein PEp14_00064 [Erwinia phage PEp14]AEY69653.1 hypothetical protein PEp14_00064 [Erwinia phage PEp14]
MVRWDRVSTRFGGYRLKDATLMDETPADLSGYTDCTTDEQFADELGTAHRLLGLTQSPGLWLGLMAASEAGVRVIALLMD